LLRRTWDDAINLVSHSVSILNTLATSPIRIIASQFNLILLSCDDHDENLPHDFFYDYIMLSSDVLTHTHAKRSVNEKLMLIDRFVIASHKNSSLLPKNK